MLLRFLNLLLFAACATAQLRAQTPLAWAHGSDNVATHLAAVQDEEYTHMAHPAFPKHGVRITRVKGFCDTTVGVYTGYVDVEARHFFFWFFESRRNPDEDDVMLWLNGGPGGSSTLGMLMELGPCNIAGPNSTAYNPHSWNSEANLIVLDQPIGVGFSYADHGETVSRTEAAAVDIAAFFAILSETFPQFQGRKLHLAGESYGGRYLPLFGSAIVDNNAYLEKWGMHPINLASVMIGNGMSDFYSFFAFRHDMLCTGASGLAPVLSISTCVRMKEATKRCLASIQDNCYTVHDTMGCDAAFSFCTTELAVPLAATGLNNYDLSKQCGDAPLCYSEAGDIATLLNSVYIRKLIKTDAQPANFSTISFDVNQAFIGAGDFSDVTTTSHLSGLLERGIRILIYVGMYDSACSWLDNERMTRIIEWSGQAAFANTSLREWKADGKSAGKVRSSGLLTFATIYGAGHMVPHDKPVESLEMVKKWLAEEDL